jgi:tetratricopeptide (TPR) repeat protein
VTTADFADFYELLQVPRSATDDDIRTAVRKQRRQWVKRQASADPNRRAEADTKVRQIDDAERTLLNHDRRNGYDRLLASYRAPEPAPDIRGSADWRDRAWAYLDQGNASAAHTAARRATNHRGSDDVAWYIRAHASFLMGRTQDAEFEFAEAIRLVPDQPDYHFDLGDVYLQQEKWPAAQREFETALHYDPNNPQYRTALAQVYCALDQSATALEIMEQVVAEHPEDESFRYYLAIALHDCALEAMSLFPDGYAPTTERQITLTERYAERIEDLGLTGSDGRALATSLRDQVAAARRPQWIPSDHVRFYVVSFLALLIVPLLIGQGALIALGFLGATGLVGVYVARHRRQTWQLADEYASGMIRRGI